MSNVRKELTIGVFWSAVTRYSGIVISLVVSMVLARLLSPEEYGVVAIATVLITFLSMFCTLGIGPAVIQRDDLTDSDLNSIFTFSISIGFLLTILFFLCSWPIASFYDNPQLIPICQILSIQLFFSAANMVPNALMSKDKRFKEIARRTLTLQIISGSISVAMAFYGAGIYALLFSPVVTSIGIFLWNRNYYKLFIDWHYNLEPIKRIFAFSSYQFLFNFFNYFARNLDKLIIGKALGPAPLGIYEKAYRLMQLPLENVTFVITPVLQPVLRDFQNDKVSLTEKYNQLIRFVATLSFPIGAIAFGMSSEAIHFFYGGRWDAAIPVLQILALSIPLQVLLSLTGSIFMVCNDTKRLFYVGICTTAITVFAFIIAAVFFKTILSIAWAWVIAQTINFAYAFYVQYRYTLEQPLLPMLSNLQKPFMVAVIVSVVLFVLNRFTYGDLMIVALLVKGLISVCAALITIQLTGLFDVISYVQLRIHHSK